MTGSPTLRELTPTRGFLLGVGAAVVGLLPTVLAGWQPSWPTYPNTPDLFTGTFLPFSPDLIGLTLGAVVLPGAIIGIALRSRTTGVPGRAEAAATAGLVLVIAVAALQSVVVTVPRLHPGSSGLLDIAVGLTVTALGLALSVLVSRVLAHRTVPAATVAAAVGVVAAGYWWASTLRMLWTWRLQLPDSALHVIVLLAQYTPAVLLGIALAWCGWTPRRRLWAWVFALLVFWVGRDVLHALQLWIIRQSHQGLVLDDLADSLVASLPVAVTAVIVGVVGRLVVPRIRRRYRERSGTRNTAPPEHAARRNS
ncbi:hypothetical protein [Isoptericola sp. b408]|uniref:hypothetical protein n=1 Tax=Isoptericola sp. b408 TaxID=3064653 RepID=UPI0027137139|nr:hypothetical protein [Isoptericola sp. b408]MDO8151236.1 hypothetical protein [Isoptericola sp. b408]